MANELAPSGFSDAAQPRDADLETTTESAKPVGVTKSVSPAPDPSGQPLGWWMEADGKLVHKYLLQLWAHWERTYRRKRRQQETRWLLLRQGKRGINVVEGETYNDYQLRQSFSGDSSAGVDNKPDTLIRRTCSLLTGDMPIPVCTVREGVPSAREGATLAERMLRSQGSPQNLDDTGFWFRMGDAAGSYGTMYSYNYYHPSALGLVPFSVQAHPTAATFAEAGTRPAPPPAPVMGPDGVAIPAAPSDPMQAPAREIAPRRELKKRFVRNDPERTLTDVQAEARMIWEGDMRRKMLYPAQVVPMPFGQSAERATSVLVGEIITVGEYIARFCEGKRPDNDTLKKLIAWKPDGLRIDEWVEPAKRAGAKVTPPTRPTADGTGEVSDEALLPILSAYVLSCADAPLGAEIVICAEPEPIVRREWSALVGPEGAQVREMSPLPVATLIWRDDQQGDPLGVPAIEDLAAASNVRTTMLELILEDAWEKGNRHTFLPMQSTFQEDEYESRDRTVWRVNRGDEPFFEEQPALPSPIYDMYDRMGSTLEEIQGLNNALATGQSPTDIKSGKQMQLVQSETRQGLADINTKFRNGITTDWNIRLSLSRRFFDSNREMQFAGPGRRMRQEAFEGLKLWGAATVEIQPGSGTLLSPMAKSQMARQDLDTAVAVGDQEAVRKYQLAIAGHTDGIMGIQDDPAKVRVDGQIFRWQQDSRQPDLPPIPAPAQSVLVTDPQTGQQVEQPGPKAPDPVEAAAMEIFDLNPADDLPRNAKIRLDALNDAMNSDAFQEADPRYKNALTQAYLRAKMCTGVMTVPEQQQAAQQQQQQQAQQSAQQENAERESKATERAEKVQDDERAHSQKLEQTAAARPPAPAPSVPMMQ